MPAHLGAWELAVELKCLDMDHRKGRGRGDCLREFAELEVELLGELVDCVAFAWFDEDERDALFTGAGGASAAVGEVFHLLGELVVDDE